VPDVVAHTRTHLLADVTVTAQVGTRVYGFDLPATPTYPAVRIIRIGGAADFEGHIDSALVQVDVFGITREDSYDSAAAVRASLHGMAGSFSGEVVSKVVEVTGPGWLPDPQTERPRWTWDVRVYAHA
jgi:hypothetical protein